MKLTAKKEIIFKYFITAFMLYLILLGASFKIGNIALAIGVFFALIFIVGVPNLYKEDKVVYFTKLHQNAKLPTKRREDAGYDIYATFDEEQFTIEPHETKMVPTGIASKFSSAYVMQLNERGSTGSKGIAQRCGIIDSGFRGQWMIPLTNTTDMRLVISKAHDRFTVIANEVMFYPYSKAIAQALLLPVPNVDIKEVNDKEFNKFDSERGKGMLGSSGK